MVFGDDVVVFSDKEITWSNHPDPNVSWARWYRKAGHKSVEQFRGAERWISSYPDRIFTDPECSQRLPVELPPAGRMSIHGVVIALGAAEACRAYFGGNDGELIIASNVRGEDHFHPTESSMLPFSVGDVDPTVRFVHVFDDTALDLAARVRHRPRFRPVPT